MLNQVVIVGNLVSEVEIKELENSKKVAYITIACKRPYKNINGEYDTDYIECTAYDQIAIKTKEYCHKGDVLGVKGRLQNNVVANNDGEITGKTITLIAEKITFLSSKSVGDK